MKKFKAMSIMLFILIIACTLKEHGAVLAPIAPVDENYEFARELPFVCRLEASDSRKSYPAIDLGTARVNQVETPARLTVVTEESGASTVWLKITAQNRHEMRSTYVTYVVVLSLIGLVSLVVAVMILVAACKILWSFARERIFTIEQSKRLNRLAIYLFIGGVFGNVMTMFTHYYAAAHISFDGWNFVMPNLLLGDFLFAFVILLFNEILKHSILLKEEQSLTI